MSGDENHAIKAMEEAMVLLRKHGWHGLEFNVTESITRETGKGPGLTSRSLILRMSFSQYAGPSKNDP